MKYAVSIYSFNQYLSQGKITPEECVEKAKEMGFDAIEIVDFVLGNDPEAMAKKLKAKADEVGIEISNFAFGLDLLKEDAVETALHRIDLAEIMGAKFIRHDVSGGGLEHKYEGYDDVLEKLADGCRKITEYGAKKGIKTTTENHGYFSQDSLRVEKLINRVAHENFGQLIDIGNFLCADEDPAVAVGRNAKYAFYVHAKDFVVKSGNETNPGEGFFSSRGGNYLKGTIIGHGNVPVVSCLRALKRVGYDGYIAVEFEGMEDCLKGIRIGFDNLKRYVQSVF